MMQDNPLSTVLGHRLALQCTGSDGIRQYDVFPPGATIGAWHGADIQLQDGSDAIAPLQAAIRFDSVRSRWAVIRLSQNGELRVDGIPLDCGQAHPISGQASLCFSSLCQIAICEDHDTPLPVAGTMPDADAEAHSDSVPAAAGAGADSNDDGTEDLFSDLLGSGTVPVGAIPSLDTRHPFSMESAAERNSHDPLRQLKPARALDALESSDPLERLDGKSWQSSGNPSLTDGSISLLGSATGMTGATTTPSILDSIGEAYASNVADKTPAAVRTRADHRPALNLPVRLHTPPQTPASSTTPTAAGTDKNRDSAPDR
ncbi:hypothetical protein [Paracandidimonas soli]|uniref:hypothetical protein n=1 Tax=Paracandidimonas soli TaxID=1917182 RepID=UPI0033420E57